MYVSCRKAWENINICFSVGIMAIFFLYDKVTERNGVESPELNQLVHRLKAVISRVARLIEIMEFDPNALSASMLNLSGDEASEWIHKLSSSHTPYILNRLQTHSEITEG